MQIDIISNERKREKMKARMKRFLSLMLAIVLVFGMVPMDAYATEGTGDGNVIVDNTGTEVDVDEAVEAVDEAKVVETKSDETEESGDDASVPVVTSAGGEEVTTMVAKIGGTEYTDFADALAAASAMTGEVTVEIYDKVTLNSSLSGSYDSIKFVGKDTDAEIYLDVQGYITATGKKVAFEDLTLSKSAGGFIGNAGFMNVAFGVYEVSEVTYTNCTFANGAYASAGKVTFTECTFKKSHEKYGLWAYGDVNATVDGCIFDNDRGIKMYAEGAEKTVDLTVKNTDFSKLTGKPAIVLTYGESVTLTDNTYSSTGVFELDLDGAPNGTEISYTDNSGDELTCVNDNGACGVLVDGKIYTTVAQAAEAATSGSAVTLLHSSTETVALPEGVTLDKNGFTADNVKVESSALAEVSTYGELVSALAKGGEIKLTANITVDTAIKVLDETTIDMNGHIIYLNVENNYFGNATIKNENDNDAGFVLGKDDVHVCDGYFLVNAGKTLTMSGLNVTSSDDGIKGYAVFHLKEGANLDLNSCVINIANNEYAGSIFYAANTNSKITMDDVNVTGENVGRGFVYCDVTMTNSNVTLKGTTENGLEHGFNGSNLMINDSNIIISGGTGRGITLGRNASTSMTVNGVSTISITDMDEATIKLNKSTDTITVAETATVTVDKQIINDNSAAVIGTIKVETAVTGLSGSGTEADPFLINNSGELIWFRDKVDEQAADGSTQFAGKYFKLTADIDLAGINWNPIGSMSGDHGSFKGVFDGGNHTISNLNVEQAGEGLGLFARTTGNAVIRNLKLDNVTVKSTDNSNYVGGLVGNSYASTKIENIHVTGVIDISGKGYIGGISGHGYVVMDNVSVIGTGTISSTFWCAGGILGYGGEGATNITNAHVEGITITSAAGGLGAIVGMAEDNEGTQPISGSNLSAKNVKIKTYTGAYGDGYADYALGYLYGGSKISKLTGDLKVEDVEVTTSTGVQPTLGDLAATINDDVYFNLQDAINAGGEVKVLKDVTLTDTLTIPADKTVTLDLNGKTISQSKECTKHYEMIKNNGNLTITGNGKISFTDEAEGDPEFGWGSYTVGNYGTLVVENGTIENLSEQNTETLVKHMYCAIQQNADGATTTINDGTISNPTYRSIRVNRGKLVINDGTIEGQVWVQPFAGNTELTIKGGSFAPTGADGSSVFVTNDSKDVTLSVTGGTFATKIGCSDAAKLSGAITGGTFTENAVKGTNKALLAENFEFVKNTDGVYGIGVLPNAEVKDLGSITVGQDEYADVTSYYIYELLGNQDQKLATGTEPFDLQIAMQFESKDTPEQAAANAFGNYTTDFFIEINGLKDGSFVGDECYLAGYYPSFEAWVKIPLDGFTIEDGKVYPVITSAGFDFKYTDICSSVQNFTCGIYLSDEVLEANPNLKVELTLGLSEDMDAALDAEFINVDEPYVYTVDNLNGYVASIETNNKTEKYTSLAKAIEAAEDGATIKLIDDHILSEGVTNTKNITLDLNGYKVSYEDSLGKTSALLSNSGNLTIIDSSENQTGKLTYCSTTPSASYGYSTSTIINTGNVVVESGTIENTTDGGASYAIDNAWYTKDISLTVNGGTIVAVRTAIRQVPFSSGYKNTVNINNGEIKGSNAGLQIHNYQSSACEVVTNITGGTFTGKYAFYTSYTAANTATKTDIQISGGTFNGYVYLYNGNAGSAEYPMNVSITDGTFNSGVYVYTKDAEGNEVVIPAISGGIYAEDISDYTVKGYKAVYDETTDKYSVEFANQAKIGNVEYKTLKTAIAKAYDGARITLLCDVDIAETLVVNKKLTLDLNGYTIKNSVSGGKAIHVDGGDLTIKDSVGEGAVIADNNGQAVRVSDKTNAKESTFTLASGMLIGTWGVTVWENGKVIVNGGEIIGAGDGSIGISGNGTYHNTYIVVNGGVISADCGIYHPQYGELTVNGGEIIGTDSGIEMRAGELVVNGGEIKSTADKYEVNANGSGTTVVGAAVAISPHTTGKDLDVTIVDGTLSGEKSFAVVKTAENSKVPTVSVVGGVFTDEIISTDETTGFVKGGYFFNDPTAYVAEGYGCTPFEEDGVTYYGVEKVYAAEYNGQKYDSLQAALDAAAMDNNSDISIELLSDVTLDITAWQTLAIGGEATEHIYINGNGHTLTFHQKNSDWNNVATKNNAVLWLNDMTIASSGHNNGPWNRYDINFACDVELNNVTSNRALAFKANANLNDVTINETNDVYAIWIQANGQSVHIDGLTVNSNGRGIKIDDQYVTAKHVDLGIENAEFTTAKKAAIVVKSADTAHIEVGENVDITNVAADNANLVWVDEDAAAVYGNVTVNGATKAQESVETFTLSVSRGDEIIGYYKTLAEAVKGAESWDTITVEADYTETSTVTIAKDTMLTLDLNGHVLTGVDTNATGSYSLIKNKGELVICDSSAGKTGKITLSATTNRGWSSYSSAISNEQGHLVVQSGTIEHTGGTNMAYAIDNLTNGNGGEAVTIVEGGKIISSYRAIRQFANSTTNENRLVVQGGEISSTSNNKGAIWLQSSNKKANKANLIVEGGNVSTVYVDGSDAKGDASQLNVHIKADCVTDGVTADLEPKYGLILDSNGNYGIEEMPVVAFVGEKEYYSLQAAIDAAADGEEVVIANDVAGPGAVIDKDVTIDFAGHCYMFTKGVGSTGTLSNGLQILKGNTVVLKNGTLGVDDANADEFYILVQNYANLTVEDMTLDGTNLDKWSTTDGDSYVLSNNSGTVNITGETNIIANNDGDKAFAFDVCKNGSYDAPTVNVSTTGIIEGKIEVSAEINSNLNISSGTFSFALEEDWCADGFIPVDNGDGTYGVQLAEIKNEAAIGSAQYVTLEKAIEDAETGENINILAAITTKPNVTIEKEITIVNADRYALWENNPIEAIKSILAEGYEVTDVAGLGMIFSITKVGESTFMVAKVGDNSYTTLEAALKAAPAGSTVELLADVNEEDARLYVYDGVTLKLGVYDIHAKSLFADEGCKVYGQPYSSNENADYAKIMVDNIELGEEPYSQSGYSYLPIMIEKEQSETYVFMQAMIYDVGSFYKLDVDTEKKEISFKFTQSISSGVCNDFLKEVGGLPVGVKMQIVLEWLEDDANNTESANIVTQTFTYSDEALKYVSDLSHYSEGRHYKFTMRGYDALDIDPNTLNVYAKIVTESGAIAKGNVHTYSN